mmetsp:Transcript_4347/g.7417  ORF Transcript_4347/g.7417 Transcript_4347/m.7417 type:complete len:525 (+) Transcript_4347:121-1695(+)
MGKQSKRNRQQRGDDPIESHLNNDGIEAENMFPLLMSIILAACTIVYEHVYPTNEFRKRKEQYSGHDFFTEASTSEGDLDNAYRLLGLTRGDCTSNEVKKSYRKLALKYHPDRQAKMSDEEKKNAELKMKDINKAYEDIQLEMEPQADHSSLSHSDSCASSDNKQNNENNEGGKAASDTSNSKMKTKRKKSKGNDEEELSGNTFPGQDFYKTSSEDEIEKERQQAEIAEMKKQQEWYHQKKKAEQETLQRMAQDSWVESPECAKPTSSGNTKKKSSNAKKRSSSNKKHGASSAKRTSTATCEDDTKTGGSMDKKCSDGATTQSDSKHGSSASSSLMKSTNENKTSGEEGVLYDDELVEKEASRKLYDTSKHELAVLLRLNLQLLLGEAIAAKENDFFANLHTCVLDDGGNTLLHYCLYYKRGDIGNQLLESCGNNWWKLVLQENKSGRNPIEEARWLGVMDEGGVDGIASGSEQSGGGESDFAARISQLTKSATEQREELEVQNNRSVDFSFIFNMLMTMSKFK